VSGDAAARVEPASVARLRGVVKRYGTGHTAFTALAGIDVDIHPGQLTLLMGPSGSGKTTLISILGCLLEATEGTVEIRGQRIDELGERRLPPVRLRNIGFVFQGFNLLRSLTALENIEVPLSLAGVPPGQAHTRAMALLASMGLQGKERQEPEDLSGGEKQRVAIARALALDPPLILADEPTAALDTGTGFQVLELLRERAHQGVAIVVVTHDVRLEPLADRILRIQDGRLVS
jgi:putative ABC transport system ATP-binding protein